MCLRVLSSAFPNVQLKLPLKHLPAVPWDPVTGHHREEISVCSSPFPHEEAVESRDLPSVSPSPGCRFLACEVQLKTKPLRVHEHKCKFNHTDFFKSQGLDLG